PAAWRATSTTSPAARTCARPSTASRRCEKTPLPAVVRAGDAVLFSRHPGTGSEHMAYIVAEPCIKCKYTDCVAVCPVECFYEGENTLAIHPDECSDCGACEPECPT